MSYNFVARTMFVATAAAVMTGVPALQASAAADVPSSETAVRETSPPTGVRGAEVFVEVTPSTVQAGDQVEIQASCDGDDREASVRSDAFGRVSVRPENGLLVGTATVPDRKPPGTFDVVLTCRNQTTASTTITVVNMSKASRGPATGGGGTAGGTVSPLVLTGGLGIVAVGAGVALIVRGRRGSGSGS
ncbi:hypothetical protein [Phytohabitans suffuscus]|uniref:Uncharacterized protein n=1 Tax=Phytohabitans suffuscus TaxID=624315 RepID=A0A6F8YWN4_9ACTN|nr:hypothetical protein [Phytohabitans suffuscus]BCB90261.1 hypothetical protein Psuf_075740 [Phytohabitans suffuscus]